jgi:hypothetical protein
MLSIRGTSHKSTFVAGNLRVKDIRMYYVVVSHTTAIVGLSFQLQGHMFLMTFVFCRQTL